MHRKIFKAYSEGMVETKDLSELGIRGSFERGRYVGYDYRAQVWVEVDFYGDDPLLD